MTRNRLIHRARLATVLLLGALGVVGCGATSRGLTADTPLAPPALEGTTWDVRVSDSPETERYTLTFDAAGILRSNHPRDTTPDDDRWAATDDGVAFSFNDGYAHYTARFTGNGTMDGEASNVITHRWRFTLKRSD
jgi:hypothetical protein